MRVGPGLQGEFLRPGPFFFETRAKEGDEMTGFYDACSMDSSLDQPSNHSARKESRTIVTDLLPLRGIRGGQKPQALPRPPSSQESDRRRAGALGAHSPPAPRGPVPAPGPR